MRLLTRIGLLIDERMFSVCVLCAIGPVVSLKLLICVGCLVLCTRWVMFLLLSAKRAPIDSLVISLFI